MIYVNSGMRIHILELLYCSKWGQGTLPTYLYIYWFNSVNQQIERQKCEESILICVYFKAFSCFDKMGLGNC
jgi:hypothetical protein